MSGLAPSASPLSLPTLAGPQLRFAALLAAADRTDWWNWGDSIAFEGLLGVGETSDESWATGFVFGALKAWLHATASFTEADNTAPGHAICLAYERFGDGELLAGAVRLAEFLLARDTMGEDGPFVVTEHALFRTPVAMLGASPRAVVVATRPGPATYVDELHMTPPFLTHLGTIIADDDLVNAGAHEAVVVMRLLQDESSGLMFHTWLSDHGERHGLGWGRGQGWAMLGVLDVLSYLPARHSARAELVDRVKRLIRAVLDLQRPDGTWWAVVDDPRSGDEASTAAFVVTALVHARRVGLVGDEVLPALARAWDATVSRTSADGVLGPVSMGVRPSTDPGAYRRVPTGAVTPWGQGALLLAYAAVAEEQLATPRTSS